MDYRTIEISWMPRTNAQWKAFSSCRKESARLWGDLVDRHFRIRRAQWKWPSKDRWQKWAKKKYPMLHSQSVQQIVGEFCEAVQSARQLRKNGFAEAKYPFKKPNWKDVPYTNQAAILRDGHIVLPNGASGKIKIRCTVAIPGRIMEVRLCMGRLIIVCEVAATSSKTERMIGIDLGVNTLIAATDGDKAVLISGRQVKSIVRLRNKHLGEISTIQSKCMRGSARWKRLQRRKAITLAKHRRQIKDILHKSTRIVANEFPNSQCFVGKPFNDASAKMGRVNAQQVSSACNGKIIQMLNYKTCGAFEVDESYSSQTCPVCERRNKARRIYKCRCGYVAPRDVVGSVNIRSFGLYGYQSAHKPLPKTIKYLRYYRSSRPGTAQVACVSTQEAAAL